ncbi:hypothetical protein V2J09_005708 [Rumex salicifolius]
MYSAHPITPVATKWLEGKVAIVTGGASGIGASAVELFSQHGAHVIIADIQDDLGRALADRLGPTVSYVRCDVSVEEQVRAAVDAAVARHGKLDVMYNNAGIIDRFGGTVHDSTANDLGRVLSVNLRGSFYGAKQAARVMAPRKQGCILFTGSACTSPVGGQASHPYVMSKYAVFGLVKALSAELGPLGIRVNCVSPSGVVTPIYPFAGFNIWAIEVGKMLAWFMKWGSLKGQSLTAEGVARAALYLASDDASHVSGHNLVLDGGDSATSHSFMSF